MSQWDLAVALGVTNGAISQWETGRTAPRRTTARRMDDILAADGEILNAYGYAAGATRLDELSELRGRVDQLEVAVTALASQLRADLEARGVEHGAVQVLSGGPNAWHAADHRSGEPTGTAGEHTVGA
jgi:transcriptional regulator with XRE-family HTH domain